MGNRNGQMVGTAENSLMNVIFTYNEYYFPDYQGNARWLWNGTGNTYEDWAGVLGQDSHSLGPSSDPLFTNPFGNDFSLVAGSPAIDRGIDVGLPFSGSAPDLGAYPFSVP